MTVNVTVLALHNMNVCLYFSETPKTIFLPLLDNKTYCQNLSNKQQFFFIFMKCSKFPHKEITKSIFLK